MKAASLITRHVEPSLALEHLLKQLVALEFRPKGLVLLTALIDDPAPLVCGIHAATGVPLVGTKTTGIGSHKSVNEYMTAVLVAFGGADCSVRTGLLSSISGDMHLAGAPEDGFTGGRLCITFPDAMSASTDRAIQTLQSIVGKTPIIGGFSADDWTFDSVQQFYGGEVLTDTAPFIVLDGNFSIAVANASGITPISSERLPVVIEGRSIHRIGEQRAFDYYTEKLGDAALFGEFPVVFEDRDSGGLRCRSPLSPNPESGVVNCGADIPAGAKVALGSATMEDLVEAAKGAAVRALWECPSPPVFAFVVSCAARLRRLGLHADEERQVIAEALKVPFVLAYLYGELAPTNDGRCALENNHIVVCAMGTSTNE